MSIRPGVAFTYLVVMLSGCPGAELQSAFFDANMNAAKSSEMKGDAAKAEAEYLDAVRRARRSLGEKEVAEALYDLGQFYRHQHREVDAVRTLKESLSIEERIFGMDDVRTGRVMAELAATYLGGGELNDAKPFIERLRPMESKYSGNERAFVEMLFQAQNPRPSDSTEFGELSAKAATGDSEAQFQLGVRYELGKGVQQDWGKARQFYVDAAAKGNVHAVYYLGVIYDKGRGVPADDVKAIEFYRKAAEGGYPIAQYNYGVFLVQGRGTEKNLRLALEYFRKADAQGYPGAKRAIQITEQKLATQRN